MRRKSWRILAAAFSAFVTLCAPALGADGDIDSTFVTDDIWRLPFSDDAEVALQPSGHVIVAGNVRRSVAAYVGRLTPTGSVDQPFGQFNGSTIVTEHNGGVHIADVAVQRDGSIVAVGQVRHLEDAVVVRLTPDGDFDPSFDGDGVARFDFAPGSSAARAVEVQPDGRIVVAGQYSSDFAIARLNADGSLDEGFAGDGTTTADLGGEIDEARALLLQGDRIVVAGLSRGDRGGYGLGVVRLLPDGSRDGSFGSANGQVNLDGMFVNDGVVTPDGGLLFVETGAGAGSDMAALKLTPSGRLDPGFSPEGPRLYGFGPESADYGQGVVVDGDGNYVLVGTAQDFAPGSTPYLAAVKITPTGALVPSFGDGGKRVYGSLGEFRATDVVRQPDGKLVVGGVDGEARNVVRIHDGTPPPQPLLEPRIDITGGTAIEGQVAIFSVVLSRPTDQPVTVGFITGEGTAATGFDFGGRRGSVTIPAGQTSGTIAIATNADFFYEPADETFRVELFDPVGARFGEYVAFGTIVNDLRPGRCQNVVVGRKGTDVLTGSPAGDLIVGRQDSDFLFGLGGADCIRGERGHDIIDGGDGDDLVDGGSGNDRLRGGDGDDRLYGRRGINRYNGGPGDDRIYARNGRSEIVECGPGRDLVKGDRGDRLRRCERITR